jgi:hypothetical protein
LVPIPYPVVAILIEPNLSNSLPTVGRFERVGFANFCKLRTDIAKDVFSMYFSGRYGVDLLDEGRHPDRFRQKNVCSGGTAGLFILTATQDRYRHNRNVSGERTGLQLTDDLPPIDIRQPYIRYDRIRLTGDGLEVRQTLILHQDGFVPGILQPCREQFAMKHVIFDHQDRLCHTYLLSRILADVLGSNTTCAQPMVIME